MFDFPGLASKPLKIISFPAELREDSNPYNSILTSELRKLGVQVSSYKPFGTRQVADVLHIHWLERIYQSGLARRSGFLSEIAFRNLYSTIVRVKKNGGRVVWTCHNLKPHDEVPERHKPSWSKWVPKIMRQFDHVVFMSRTSAELARCQIDEIRETPYSIIPHPHYRNSYTSLMSREECLVHFGLPKSDKIATAIGYIRPYKGIEKTLTSFVKAARDNELLVVAGQCSDEKIRFFVSELTKHCENIVFIDRSLTSAELAALYSISDLAIFNFKSILNSGSVLTSLSLDVPVAVPVNDAMLEVQQSVGARWVTTFKELTHLQMRELLDTVGKPVGRPDLSQHEPNLVGQMHLKVYAAR